MGTAESNGISVELPSCSSLCAPEGVFEFCFVKTQIFTRINPALHTDTAPQRSLPSQRRAEEAPIPARMRRWPRGHELRASPLSFRISREEKPSTARPRAATGRSAASARRNAALCDWPAPARLPIRPPIGRRRRAFAELPAPPPPSLCAQAHRAFLLPSARRACEGLAGARCTPGRQRAATRRRRRSQDGRGVLPRKCRPRRAGGAARRGEHGPGGERAVRALRRRRRRVVPGAALRRAPAPALRRLLWNGREENGGGKGRERKEAAGGGGSGGGLQCGGAVRLRAVPPREEGRAALRAERWACGGGGREWALLRGVRLRAAPGPAGCGARVRWESLSLSFQQL